MLSKKFINQVIDNAKIDDLRNFTKSVLDHIIARQAWTDKYVNNAIELIWGCGKNYTKEDIDIDKALNYIQKEIYNGKQATYAKINCIDNIDLDVIIIYGYREKDGTVKESSIRMAIEDVLKTSSNVK